MFQVHFFLISFLRVTSVNTWWRSSALYRLEAIASRLEEKAAFKKAALFVDLGLYFVSRDRNGPLSTSNRTFGKKRCILSGTNRLLQPSTSQ